VILTGRQLCGQVGRGPKQVTFAMTDSDIWRVADQQPAQSTPAPVDNFAPVPSPQPPPAFVEDLIGRRIGAALIDLVLLAGLGLILGLTVGEFSFGDGTFSIVLTGGWALLHVGLALLYYFAAEATTGQTVGKRLAGLQVVRRDGSGPSTGAVAGRTLLRVIDWLPLLYLVGFVATLATGARRERLGDMAARTAVRRAAPGQSRAAAVTILILVLGLAGGLFAYRASATVTASGPGVDSQGVQTYQRHGVRFEYPAGWHEAYMATTGSEDNTTPLWSAGVWPHATGAADVIMVNAYRLEVPPAQEDVQAALTQFTDQVKGMYEQSGGTLRTGPEDVTIAGTPGVRFTGTMTMDGTRVERIDVFFFAGSTKYALECHAVPDVFDEVARGCDLVQRTLTLTQPAGALG
jgi:uncharacterized RDD family membrane protein YckC